MTPEQASQSAGGTTFSAGQACALQLDRTDPLAPYRQRFCIPARHDGEPVIYLAGNSLGLQPKSVRTLMGEELDDWAKLAVDAHFDGKRPWYPYHEMFREPAARLVGAEPGEVVMMNSLTVNLHLLMVTFFRPTTDRYKIVMEWPAFPSDIYAIKTQIRHHGLDPADALLTVRPREGEHTIRADDIESLIDAEGDRIALILLGGVSFFSGQLFDMARITQAGHAKGCTVGFDLAHAAGNVELRLHDWEVDFAVWCTYKYLNSGPGAVAGCFVHERHGRNTDLPRFGGWWGNDPDTRFRMHLNPEFIPRPGADGWQISNPPIMAMAPVRASMDIFDEVGMPALCEKSKRLTGYMQYLIDQHPREHYSVITPRNPDGRGCQLSILVHDRPRERFQALLDAGVICDFREPNIIRAAPVPLYNTFEDVWRFVDMLTAQR